MTDPQTAIHVFDAGLVKAIKPMTAPVTFEPRPTIMRSPMIPSTGLVSEAPARSADAEAASKQNQVPILATAMVKEALANRDAITGIGGGSFEAVGDRGTSSVFFCVVVCLTFSVAFVFAPAGPSAMGVRAPARSSRARRLRLKERAK